MMQIKYYVAFYESRSALIFHGNKDQIGELRDLFLNWNKIDTEILTELSYKIRIVNNNIEAINLHYTDKYGYNHVEYDHSSINWTLDQHEVTQIVGLLDGLMQSDDPGHQYLNDATGPIDVIASMNENSNRDVGA